MAPVALHMLRNNKRSLDLNAPTLTDRSEASLSASYSSKAQVCRSSSCQSCQDSTFAAHEGRPRSARSFADRAGSSCPAPTSSCRSICITETPATCCSGGLDADDSPDSTPASASMPPTASVSTSTEGYRARCSSAAQSPRRSALGSCRQSSAVCDAQRFCTIAATCRWKVYVSRLPSKRSRWQSSAMLLTNRQRSCRAGAPAALRPRCATQSASAAVAEGRNSGTSKPMRTARSTLCRRRAPTGTADARPPQSPSASRTRSKLAPCRSRAPWRLTTSALVSTSPASAAESSFRRAACVTP
mmetsp:Transcript_90927/g.262082  ORF Transcript_90927/g.262082 Transcript_90927/m.262082 type:complete len:301 (-) Transcript_90927:577-1479(-)